MYYLIALLIILAVFVIGIYNALVKLRNRAENAWADIDTQLKRRYNLIDNLVETVKGYASHEQATFEKVVQARSSAISAQTPAEQAKAENFLSETLKSIFALSESYPDLKANTNFLELQQTLESTEDLIQHARQYYNAVVRDFNTKLETFPNNLIAGALSFTKREYFELDDAQQRQAPDVNFSDNATDQKPSS